MKIEIKHGLTGTILFSVEADSWKIAAEMAVKSGANLGGANLREAKQGIPIESQSVAIRLNLLGISLPAEIFTFLYGGICWEQAKNLKISRTLRSQIKKVWPELIKKFESPT